MEFVDDASRWQAVVDRNAAAEGRFFYAVTSTGIYCRPTCPSRRPRRENVRFFDSPTAAEQAGFRPCRRCTPSAVTGRQQVVAQVQALIDAADPAPTLAQLSEAVGLSPSHLQRLFKEATGLSPRAYGAARRAERLKAGLKRGADVTTALYEAGYGSSRALYEAAPQHLGMSPGAYRSGGQGVVIRYTVVETALGHMLLAATESGICALRFGEPEPLLAELTAEFPRAELLYDDADLARHADAVRSHLAGVNRRLDLPLDVKATAFQQKVWAALRAIPYGETRSYRDVAAMIGEPAAVRAVARACAANPVALVVPCHRVVRTGGALSGYRWGVERKRQLLEQEGK